MEMKAILPTQNLFGKTIFYMTLFLLRFFFNIPLLSLKGYNTKTQFDNQIIGLMVELSVFKCLHSNNELLYHQY